MTEPNQTPGRAIDPSRMNIPNELRKLLGTEPLIIHAPLKDGRVSPDDVRAVGNAIVDRLRRAGLPAEIIDGLESRVEQTASDPSAVMRGDSSRKEREDVTGQLRAAIKILRDVADDIEKLSAVHAGFTQSAIKIHRFSHVLGIAAGSVMSAEGELRAAIQGIEHAFECGCMGDDEAPKDEPKDERHGDLNDVAAPLAPEAP